MNRELREGSLLRPKGESLVARFLVSRLRRHRLLCFVDVTTGQVAIVFTHCQETRVDFRVRALTYEQVQLARYNVQGQIAHVHARHKRATDFMRDRHGEAGHDANKTALNHVVCATKTPHRAVRVP